MFGFYEIWNLQYSKIQRLKVILNLTVDIFENRIFFKKETKFDAIIQFHGFFIDFVSWCKVNCYSFLSRPS